MLEQNRAQAQELTHLQDTIRERDGQIRALEARIARQGAQIQQLLALTQQNSSSSQLETPTPTCQINPAASLEIAYQPLPAWYPYPTLSEASFLQDPYQQQQLFHQAAPPPPSAFTLRPPPPPLPQQQHQHQHQHQQSSSRASLTHNARSSDDRSGVALPEDLAPVSGRPRHA